MKKAIIKYIVILIVILGAVFGIYNHEKFKQEQIAQDIQINRQSVKQLELKDVNEIEGRLKSIRKEYGIGRQDAEAISNKRYFEDSVFMGDSLMEPLSLYDFLPPGNVVAKMGRNTYTAIEDVKDIKKMAPERIFMMYGMNDLNVTDNVPDFKESYLKLINEVRKVQPNSEIVLLSVLPVTEDAVKRQKTLSYDRILEFNGAIKEIAEENSFIYLDVTELVRESGIYEPDGIHVKAAFYGKFLDFIKSEFTSRL